MCVLLLTGRVCYMQAHMQARMHAYMHACIRTYVNTYMHAGLHACQTYIRRETERREREREKQKKSGAGELLLKERRPLAAIKARWGAGATGLGLTRNKRHTA